MSRRPGRESVNVVIRLTSHEETKALPILLRHSPGMILRHRTYVLNEKAVEALQAAGVQFRLLTRAGKAR